MTNQEMFEAWFKKEYPNQYAFKESTHSCQAFYDNAWIGWQAATQREGYKLVHVEPTYKQLDALKNSCVLFQKAGVSDLEANGAYKAMIGAAL